MATYVVTMMSGGEDMKIEAGGFDVDEHWVRFYELPNSSPLKAAIRTTSVWHISEEAAPKAAPEDVSASVR